MRNLLKFFLISAAIQIATVQKSPFWFSGSSKRSCGMVLTKRLSRICNTLGGFHKLAEEHHRTRRRVADECCKQVCSDTELTKYCIDDPGSDFQRQFDATNSNQRMNGASEPKVLRPPEFGTSDDYIDYSLTPIKIGTVAPEYKLSAINVPISRAISIP